MGPALVSDLMREALPLFVVSFVLSSACSSEEGEVGALERALAKARPMHEVVDPATAATRPWDGGVPLPDLVAHRLESELKVVVTFGDTVQALTISRSIAREGRRFRFVERRVHREPSLADPAASLETATRFEVVFDGERLASKRGTGPFIERDARDGLPARLLTHAHDLAPMVFASFGDYLTETPSPGRAAELAGLRPEWRALSLDPTVRPRTMNEVELNALRDHDENVFAWAAATFRPTKVVGRVGRLGGEPLECELSFAGGVRGPANAGGGGFTLELTQRVSPLAESAIATLSERAPADFSIPKDALPADRPRPWKMIEDVLGDELLPPYRTP